MDIDISSDVPLGAGLSSSAALTCSVGSAIGAEFGLGLDRVEVAELARRSENEFAGAPTGLMDQLASMLGEEGHALLLDCRSLETRSIPLDLAAAGLTLMLVDTHARHELVDGEYGARRRDCEEAARLLGRASLRDAALDEVVTLADEQLQRRAHHVVTEIGRVRDVVDILDAARPADIGGYLTASHESLRDDFEVSCTELDVAVDAALAAGALGARMTGGGFGGCVVALARAAEVDGITGAIEAAYRERGWEHPTIWHPSPSAGAQAVDGDDDDDR
jgi:galactokinase